MKTSRENKRLLSWILSLALVFSVLGVSAGTAKAETTGAESTGVTARAATGQSITVKGEVKYMDQDGTLNAATGSALLVGGGDSKTATVDENGKFMIEDVVEGTYSISVSWRTQRIDKKIHVTATSNTPETNPQLKFVMSPAEKVEMTSDTDIPGVIVDDVTMAKLFLATATVTDPIHGITQDDLGVISAGGKVTLEMGVNDVDFTNISELAQYDIGRGDKNKVDTRAQTDGSNVVKYFSVKLDKTVAPASGSSRETNLIESNDLIKITIPLADSDIVSDAGSYRVYRSHKEGSSRVAQVVDETPNADGEKITVDTAKKTLTLHVKKFCLYALAYQRASGPIWYPTPVATQTAAPTTEPTEEPTVTAEPTIEPTNEPTAEPSKEPEATVVPTAGPTQEPQATAEPAEEPEQKKVVVKKMLLEATNIKSTSTKLVWDKLPDADGYDLYQSKCNTGTKTYKIKFKKTFKSGEKHTFALKGLKKGVWYKNRIYAWKMIDGKKVVIGKSLTVHHYHKKNNDKSKWGNPTGIKLSKTKLSLKKGKTAKLSAKALSSGKDLGRHGKRIRYVVSNTKVASVSASGKVKGKKKGTCTVYVVAQSGLKKKVKVTVK